MKTGDKGPASGILAPVLGSRMSQEGTKIGGFHLSVSLSEEN